MGGGGAGAETTKKALRASATDGEGASVPQVEQQQKKQSAPFPAAGVVGSADGGSAAVHQSCGEDDQDDEQVERFYALIANIRALRGLYGSGEDVELRRGRKRAREAEVPWTPAFRLEDFEEEVNNQGTAAADARCPAVTVNQGASGGTARRARARAAVAAADDGHEEDGVAEVARGGGGNKLGRRRVAARG